MIIMMNEPFHQETQERNNVFSCQDSIDLKTWCITWISHCTYPLVKHGWLENEPVEDVFPIEDADFPASHVSLQDSKT